jgi:hypothetical protein
MRGPRSLIAVASLVAAVFAVLLFGARTARAEQVDVRASLDTDTVELGDTLSYSLNVTVRGGSQPSDPKPGAHPGFDVVGTSSAPVHMNMNLNGQVSSLDSLVTTWTLRASKVGSFTLGPASISVGGSRRSAATVRVRVVPRGQAPARPPSRGRGGRGSRGVDPFDPFGGSAFDPWKGIFGFGDDDDSRAFPQPEPTADAKLSLDAPRAPVAFLHAVVDKKSAVVGEQVTASVYLYQDPYKHPGQPADVHEATATAFAKKSLLDGDMRAIPVGTAMVGGRLWQVSIVRKDALFPLKTGHLAIEPMSLTFPQLRAGKRESERLFVDVTEPPAAGRPPGYALGDVGDMSLQATVTPRSIDRDGAVGVTVELRGTGNLPAKLPLPVAPGVEWLDAQSKEDLKAVGNDRFGGTRTFSYVVRIHRSGTIDLGEIRLPYYDADKKTYDVARATLGIVDVAKGKEGARPEDPADQILPDLPKPRLALERPRPETYLSERPIFWGFLFGSPLSCVLAIGAATAARRVRDARAAKSPSRAKIAKDRRSEAESACRGDDAKAAMGAIARAVEAGVLDQTGVNVRGGDGATIRRELEDGGVPEERAKSIVAVLRACEDARFSPDGVTIDAARKTWSEAKELLDATGGQA